MATTYVYSTDPRARVTHVGNLHGTACGFVFFASFHVSEDAPPARPICKRCIARAHAAALREARLECRLVEDPEKNARVRRARIAARRAALIAARQAQRDALIIAALKEGLANVAVARRLHMGLRTAVRRISTAQRRAGVKTRFQWGYKIGFAEGRAQGHAES
ncbi:MAG: hypothetical protein QOE45_2235 [Frankiaceae bacterium]|jgi:DNA-binding NarL/FixJ family response regulator|nr:hypothetical protein [Frankiaceae bacterium]